MTRTRMGCGHFEDLNTNLRRNTTYELCDECVARIMPVIRSGPPPWSAKDQRRIDEIRRSRR